MSCLLILLVINPHEAYQDESNQTDTSSQEGPIPLLMHASNAWPDERRIASPEAKLWKMLESIVLTGIQPLSLLISPGTQINPETIARLNHLNQAAGAPARAPRRA